MKNKKNEKKEKETNFEYELKKEDIKNNKILTIILKVLISMLLVGAFIYVMLLNFNYEIPVSNYYKGLNNHNKRMILRSYHHCLQTNEGFKALVEEYLTPMDNYQEAHFKYKITSKKKMSKEELNIEQKDYDSTCGVKQVTIKDGYNLSITQKEKLTKDLEYREKKVTIKVVKINNRWYLSE